MRYALLPLMMLAAQAQATTCPNGAQNFPTCSYLQPSSSSASTSSSSSKSSADQHQGQHQGQQQEMDQRQNATGGAGGSFTDQSRSFGYVFPAPVYATPLPANLCPKGDSLAWSIGWNFFSYATSSTRTEMECLDKWLEANRRPAPPAPRLTIIEPIHPPVVVAPKPPVKPVPKKPCPANQKLQCVKA